MKVISLGWGVQSFTLSAMSALGELPPVDAAIHADTTHERSDTYTFAEKWKSWLSERGVNVVTISDEKAAGRIWHGEMVPAYTETGQAFRTCTDRWKIAPMRRWLQAHRNGEQVEQWIGYSLDEIQRLKHSNVKYVTNRFPLIEQRMTRIACMSWLSNHGLEIPPKSACVFCPLHSQNAWRDLRERGGADWEKAQKVDELIRDARPPVKLFLNDHLIPITEISASAKESGQLDMFEMDECSGSCFL